MRQRNRTGTTTYSTTTKQYYPVSAPTSSTSSSYTVNLEHMVDTIEHHVKIKPCSHVKRVYPDSTWTGSGRTRDGAMGVTHSFSGNLAGIIETSGSSSWRVAGSYSYQSKMAELVSDLYEDITGQIKTSGLIVSFLEIAEMKRLIPGILHALKRIMSGGWNTIKGVAAAHLTNEFGLKQLLRDLDSILRCIDTVQRRINALHNREARFVKLTRRRVSQLVCTDGNYARIANAPYADTYDYALLRRNMHGTVTEVVGCSVYSENRYSVDELARQLMAQFLGVDRPVSAGWNILPFSFIVDWVIDVSSRIAAFETRLLNIEGRMKNIFIKDGWNSTRVECAYDYMMTKTQLGPRSYPHVEGPVGLGRGSIETYARQASLPAAGRLPVGWSLHQTVLGASLILTRKR